MNTRHPSLRIFALSIILVIIPACSSGPDSAEEAGLMFLEALQNREFQEAAELSVEGTAAIVLFMEKMQDADGSETRDLKFPIPPADTQILIISQERGEGLERLKFRAGDYTVVLHVIRTTEGWFVELPRESWAAEDNY